MFMKKVVLASLCFFTAGLHGVHGETVVLKGQITPPSTELIFNTFVKNAGIVDPSHPPSHYFVVLGAVKNVAPQDISKVRQILEEGIAHHKKLTLVLRVDLAMASHFNNEIVLLAEYPQNSLNNLSHGLKNYMEHHLAKLPCAGKEKYVFSALKGREFTPYISVGAKFENHHETVKVINDRLEQDRLIEKQCPLYNHKVDALVIDVMGDNELLQAAPLPPVLPAPHHKKHHKKHHSHDHAKTQKEQAASPESKPEAKGEVKPAQAEVKTASTPEASAKA